MHRLILVSTLAVLFGGIACARAYPPPGGERDTLPPRLIATTPGPLEVVPDFSGPVVFRFDERLSERNFTESLVLVSPLDSTIRVQRGRSEVRVSLDGGWRPDRVYRVTLLPGVRDLFGNAREEAAEIVFSTGPPVAETAVAGIVQDRLTGRAAATPVVRATRRADSVVYTAQGDNTGFFSLRHLPLGTYDVLAFSDQNRNRRRDAAEPLDSAVVSLGTESDTVTIIFNVLAPDTTPPRVTRVELVDSLHVRVTFDDYFDVQEPVQGVTAEVHALPDSTRFAGSVRVLQAPLFEAHRRAAAALAARDTAAAVDTAGVAGDTARVAAPPAAAARERPPLPVRDLVVQLDRALEAGQTYAVTVRGAVNISGLGGGGTATLEVPVRQQAPVRPPPADTSGTRLR